MSADEIDAAAIDMLPEIAGLASDYLGNTVVQKLWGRCSEQVKDQMLAKIAPHMAKIGTHKNGTWAAQMIIKEILKDNFSDSRRAIIAEHMRPFTPASLVDQYGNYVVQCCLPFGLPHNNFIFEALMSRMTQLSQDRFAARAMRGCLESPNSTKQQQKLLLAQIVIHSVHLATDQNGALLLTWYLDTWDFPHRRRVLAPRLVPHLVYLCTHKVAYLTVLKVINQTSEPEAQKTLLDALFFSPSDQVLDAILRDSSYGATLIFKVLTSQEVDDSIRAQIADKIKAVLLRIKPQSNQGYRRLMDEVGLPTNRNGSSGREATRPTEPRQRPTSRHANGNGHHDQQGTPHKQQFHKQSNQQAGYDMGYGQQRNEMADASVSAFPPFNQAMMYNGANGGMPGVNMQQAPYQQNMMGRGGPPANYNFPAVQPGYGAYGGAGPSVEQYRQMNMPNGSPIQPPATHMQPQFPGGQGSFVPPPGFGMPMGGQAGYGYGNMGGGGMPNVNYGPQGQGNRRNHVRRAQR
jgi:protein JSN1